MSESVESTEPTELIKPTESIEITNTTYPYIQIDQIITQEDLSYDISECKQRIRMFEKCIKHIEENKESTIHLAVKFSRCDGDQRAQYKYGINYFQKLLDKKQSDKAKLFSFI